MALGRKFLSAMGIEADKIDEIISAHTETVDALKDELSKAKADASKLSAVQKELDELKAAAEKDGKDPYKVKYEAIKEEFENYKKDQSAKESKAKKADAYKALLKECGVSEKRIDAVLKVSDIDSLKFGDDGKLENEADLKKDIAKEWAYFIQVKATQGAETATPPHGTDSQFKTREEIYKKNERGQFVLTASQRQEALSKIIAEEQQKGH